MEPLGLIGKGSPSLFGGRSALPLLVPGIRADHIDLALAADDLAVLTDPLDTRSHFHGSSLVGSDDPPFSGLQPGETDEALKRGNTIIQAKAEGC
jgi:hypothetical protein